MTELLSKKQIEFIKFGTRKWNIAHGSVRSGKTIGTLFAFMHAVHNCPDSKIWMIGKSSDTIYDNAIRLLLEPSPSGMPDPLSVFRPFCTWFPGKRELHFKDKIISTLGARDEGCIGAFQGKTFSLCYCDEMTLYPESIIDMIDTRLSFPHSKGFASMNPSHPNHRLKKWIDKAEEGDENYYALQFTLDDNPYVDEAYKLRIASSLSGLFYKRNYLGLWCLAEGAVFDFFDPKIHVVENAPTAAEYFVAGIDYGTSNSFACTVMGVNTGKTTQTGVLKWFEDEYVWDSKKKGRQKTNSEYANDVLEFLEPYGVRAIYVDPSAAAFKLELRKHSMPVVDANNDVKNGLSYFTSELARGAVFIKANCKNLIREIEGYVWDPKSAERGIDEPIKKDDHSIDSARYSLFTHKVSTYDYEKHQRLQAEYMQNKFNPRPRFF